MERRNQYPAVLMPPGLLVTKSWLRAQNVDRHTIDNWLKSGRIVAVARGVFKRPDIDLTWQGVVCSLQRMKLDLTPGGLTALALQGMTHYVSPIEHGTIRLYGRSQLPTWAKKLLPETAFVRHAPLELTSCGDSEPGIATVPWRTQFTPFGGETWSMQVSSPEQAILEVLMDVPKTLSFEHANNLLQGLPTLSPHKLNYLLGHCQSVKVKRLFLWLAELNNTPWLKHLDLREFSIAGGMLGSGKRLIAKNGRLDSKYLITVPAHMAGDVLG